MHGLHIAVVSRRAYDVSAELVAMEPIGFFDLLGFSKGDEATFKFLRATEIKHGCVSMMAAVGAVAQHYQAPGLRERAVWHGCCNHRPMEPRLRGTLLSFRYLGARCLDGIPKLGAW